MTRLERLADRLRRLIGDTGGSSVASERGEVSITVPAHDYLAMATQLKESSELRFEQLIDLSGVDYAGYGNRALEGKRFAVVSQLLSVSYNWRVRLKTFADEDDFPVVASLTDIWPSANWYEREAFDLYGVMFEGHPDLRRILTDYGFVGHPFRKDFPISGFVEMRYDPEQGRVAYQPVSIEPRENTPRIVREASFGGADG